MSNVTPAPQTTPKAGQQTGTKQRAVPGKPAQGQTTPATNPSQQPRK
jgi:hypothetical protein